MADDATSVPGSLFGNLPLNASGADQRPASSALSGDDDTQSYIDFYARLGNRRGAEQSSSISASNRLDESEDLEASLLRRTDEAAVQSSRFDLLSPTATWFAKHRKKC